jgi:sulfatase maturation enzyme AslB (radical SAM superfamily)
LRTVGTEGSGVTYKYIPETMNIETVLGCNARCIMCSIGTWEREHGMMDPDVFAEIVEQMKDFKDNLKSVALFLDGEPLIDKHLETRIAHAKRSGIPNIGFTSNGSLFSLERTRAILEAEPDWIVFSLDSLRKETYEQIRVRLKFDRVQKNVAEMIRMRDRMGAKTRLIVRFIEQDLNRGQFEEFKNHYSALLDNERDEIHFSGTHNWSMAGAEKGVDYGNTACGYLFSKFTIFRDGSVPICCIDFNGAHVMGNVMQNHILEIYNSAEYNSARDTHSRGQRGTMHLCDTCDVPETNHKGVLSMKIQPDGKMISNDVFASFDHEETRKRMRETAAAE